MSRTLFFVIIALGILWLVSPVMAADPGKGNILIEEWINTGNAVTDNVDTLHAYINAGNQPTRAYWTKVFDRPDGGEDYWGGRFRGYIYPPQTGDYTFWTSSDDDSEIWLSTDDTPANVKMICNVEGWMPYLAWDGTGGAPGTTFKSKPITLTAGKRYYVETFFSDGTGGGFQTVGWGGPGIGAGPVIVDGKYLAPWIRTPEPMFQAKNPNPKDGALGVAAPLLTWDAGPTALWHDVYFGTTNPPPLIGRQLFNVYYHIPGLTPGATYYWKVDEIEADGVTMYKGPLWTFVAQAVTAYYPSPTDGAGSVSPNVTLTWQPGLGSTKHQLYLSDSRDDVAAGAAAADKGALTETTYTPTNLQGATTYYWRVDEIAADGTRKTGPVWSFTTFILVDDFESYNDTDNRIYDTWLDNFDPKGDGSGSVVGNDPAPFAERVIVHGGKQSLPMGYNNAGPKFLVSETVREFSPLANWTGNAVDTLSLWFQGQAVAFLDKGGNAYTVSGSGHDIWDNADDFRFVYKSLSGNGTMTAKVESLVNTNAWAKAGVMIRETLDEGSKHAFMPVTTGNSCSFQWRNATGGTSNSTNWTGTAVTTPYWVRITRTGNVFKGETSPDGKTWTAFVPDQTITMAANCYIGLAVTSHDTARTTTAEFSNVSASASATGAWKVAVIGTDPEPANAPDKLYVVVADSAGKTATATNADPAATVVTAWTQWKIPLSSLTGVNLAKVKTLSIGVGNKAAPAAGGAGRIFIDDIQVTKP